MLSGNYWKSMKEIKIQAEKCCMYCTVCVYTGQYLRSEWLRESSMWYPDVSLQELDHRQGEGQLISPLLHFCPGQVVLHHELGQVTHDL